MKRSAENYWAFPRVGYVKSQQTAISGFRRDADETCALLWCYAASSRNPLPKFRGNVSVPSSKANKFNFFLNFLTFEDGTDTSPGNVGKVLQLDAAQYPTREQFPQ
jgi:hypothetical protein